MKTTFTVLMAGLCMTGLILAEVPADSAAVSPYTKKNNSWIMLSGKVTEANADGFTLDYGKGAVYVEMDDWDWYKEGHALLKGDTVSVDGRVDRDKGEKTSIEASSVFVHGLRTYFYASAEDEEDAPRVLMLPNNPNGIMMQGTVTKLDGREFTLTNDFGEIVVDTKALNYNPMDDKGYQQIRVGDVVRVYGAVDKGFLEPDEIHPTSIISIRKF